jgi:hypothetical protein
MRSQRGQEKLRRCKICRNRSEDQCKKWGGGLANVVWKCARSNWAPFDPMKPRIEKITEMRVGFTKERMQMGRSASEKKTVITISTYYCFAGGDKLAEILKEATGRTWRFIWNYMDTSFFETDGEPPDDFEITIPWSETRTHYE